MDTPKGESAPLLRKVKRWDNEKYEGKTCCFYISDKDSYKEKKDETCGCCWAYNKDVGVVYTKRYTWTVVTCAGVYYESSVSYSTKEDAAQRAKSSYITDGGTMCDGTKHEKTCDLYSFPKITPTGL